MKMHKPSVPFAELRSEDQGQSNGGTVDQINKLSDDQCRYALWILTSMLGGTGLADTVAEVLMKYEGENWSNRFREARLILAQYLFDHDKAKPFLKKLRKQIRKRLKKEGFGSED